MALAVARISGAESSEISTFRPSLRLETAEPEPLAFVLDVDGGDTDAPGQRRQSMQRRLGVVVAETEIALDLLGGGVAERFSILRYQRLAIVGVGVAQEHDCLL
jgi:hypothetical protein